MNPAAFLAKWEARARELRALHAHVDGAALSEEAVRDFTAVMASEDGELLSLPVAAVMSGYSKDHLARLIRQGREALRGGA